MKNAAIALLLLFLCNPPMEPYCLGSLAYTDADSANECRGRIERFRDETEHFVKCIDEARSDALRKVNGAVERWNRFLRSR